MRVPVPHLRAVSSSPASFTSATARWQPRPAHDCATARPMPLAAALTMAVRPCSCMRAAILVPCWTFPSSHDSIRWGERQMSNQADVIIIGAGLAGLVAAAEVADSGKRAIIVEQEGEQSLGGQAFWSLGGLFLVDSPEQRRLGIRDSHELALQDWLGTAGFDRAEDPLPGQRGHAFGDFAAGEKRSWLRERGLQTFPVVGWAERGGYDARGHGNSVPRFHITWGTGPAIVDIFARRLMGNAKVRFAHRHRVDELIVENGAAVGVRGAVLEPTTAARGMPSSRNTVAE